MMAKDNGDKKWKPIETMTVVQLKKFITEQTARAERLAAVDEDLGPGWKIAAEGVLREVGQARDRLTELEK